MGVTLLLAAASLCGFGWAMIAYAGYARPRGLPTRALYATDFSWLQGVAYLAMLCGLVLGFLAAGWWGPIVVLVGGNVVTRLLLPSAKQNTQVIAPGAVVVLAIVCAFVWLGQ